MNYSGKEKVEVPGLMDIKARWLMVERRVYKSFSVIWDMSSSSFCCEKGVWGHDLPR